MKTINPIAAVIKTAYEGIELQKAEAVRKEKEAKTTWIKSLIVVIVLGALVLLITKP